MKTEDSSSLVKSTHDRNPGGLIPPPEPHHIAVVIPSYRVTQHILQVIAEIGEEVTSIYVVDDCCPDSSGKFVIGNCRDSRVKVLFNEQNLGVGGATLTGMRQAILDGANVIVKIDGDGQMDPALIPSFVGVIVNGEADYAKGNRFFEIEGLRQMPPIRLLGNAFLSFASKLSSGYWNCLDPTNGYFAVHAEVASFLPIEKIAPRFFFESDLLFRLNIIGARVVDIPMHSRYGNEVSNLKPIQEIWSFSISHARNFFKRVMYNYFIRDFSIASVELIGGLALLVFGLVFGAFNWGVDSPASAGTVMLAAMPVILGVQFIVAFLNYDIRTVPTTALHSRIRKSLRPLKVPVVERDEQLDNVVEGRQRVQ
jgi:dolichol-phosphate mannosyltransferase